MHYNIYHVSFEYAQVSQPKPGRGRSEENVRNVGSDHAASPPICEGSTDCVLHDVFGILVITDVSAVQRFNHLAVNLKQVADFDQVFLAGFGSPPYRSQFTALLTELCQK